MILPESYEEIAAYIDSTKKVVFFFTADWCPDCQFIYPVMPSIEKDFSDFVFVRVNRDDYIELAQQWNIFGIPSFVVVENGQELGRLVNKN
ncbi:TPA: thioredoxin family protein, partial [Streptococcus agalactiae]